MLTFLSLNSKILQLETQSAIQQSETRQITNAQRTEERRLRDQQGKMEYIQLLIRKFMGHSFSPKRIDQMALDGILR
jgi:hypothetical protein